MAVNATPSSTGLCPLCNQRPVETKVYYDEAVSSRTTKTAITRRRSSYSTRAITSYGHMQVCASCAQRYESSISLRKTGRRLLNVGIIIMIVGGLIFALTLPQVSGTMLELVTAAPVPLGVILVLVGFVIHANGNRQKQPMLRYLQVQLSK